MGQYFKLLNLDKGVILKTDGVKLMEIMCNGVRLANLLTVPDFQELKFSEVEIASAKARR